MEYTCKSKQGGEVMRLTKLLSTLSMVSTIAVGVYQIGFADDSVLLWKDQDVCANTFILRLSIENITIQNEKEQVLATMVKPPKALTNFRIKFKDGAYGLGTLCKYTIKRLTDNQYLDIYYLVWRDSLRPTFIELGAVSQLPVTQKGGEL